MRIWLIGLTVLAIAAVGGTALYTQRAGGVDFKLASASAPTVTHDAAAVFSAPAPGETGGEGPLQAPAPPPGVGGQPPAGQAPPAGDAPAAEGDAAAAPPAAENLSNEEWLARLDEWKNQDPREVIEKKYDDLESKKTDPSNPDNPEGFIPETGRVDPLTPVNSAIPEELRPPRSGDTDRNEFETYLYSKAATEGVDVIGFAIQVHNVVQIGLQKLATISFGGQKFTVPEGAGGPIPYVSQDGIPVNVEFTVISISEDEVVIGATGTPQGSTVSISKTFNFIPR